MTEQKTAYPLCWPEGWPRTKFREGSRFGSHALRPSMEKATDALSRELDLLGGTGAILSSNIKVKLNGLPYSNLSQPPDVGAALYFKLKGKDVALACDKWNRVECNVYAMAKHIEALRGQDRWGVGNIEQAFRGYMALPAVGQSSGDRPWEVLGLPINATEDQLIEAYRHLSKKFHPDNPNTGEAERFLRIKAAYDLMAQNLRKTAA